MAGTGASDGSLLVRLTRAPPAGAGPLRSGSTVTVPPLATTSLGPNSREYRYTGVTVRLTDAEDDPSVPVTVTAVAVVTAPAV